MPKLINTALDRRVIAAYLESPQGARVIGKQFHLGATTVQRILRRNNIPIPAQKYHSRSVKRYAFTSAQEAAIVSDYHQRGSALAVATAQNACYATVLRVLKRHGITPTFGRPKREAAPEVIAQVAALTQQGISRTELSQRFKVRHETISNWLRLGGIEKRLRPGPKHFSGRYVRGDGYVNVMVPVGHPFSSMAMVTGYVTEHRLVMAQHLGRSLLSSESVHHINGKRDDNRLENLQLRHGKHGKGERFVCVDCGSHNIRAEEFA
jgi:transposase-like protein